MRVQAVKERTKRRYKRYWNNLKEVKWHILQRFLSLILMSAFFSSIATLLNINGIFLNTREKLMMGLSVMSLWFLALDVMLMRKDYYRLTHRRKYRMVSYISHSVFALVNILTCRFFAHSYMYAFIFSITKFARYTHYNLNPVLSAVIFNAVLIIAIRYAPIGMKWLHMHHG